MNIRRKRRLKKKTRMSKAKREVEKQRGNKINGKRPFVKKHPRRKVNKSTKNKNKAERKIEEAKAYVKLTILYGPKS